MFNTTNASVRLGSEALARSDVALEMEWLETNGIGGYSSATLAGANTRRYHGLLVGALHPPVGRCVLLSKLDEVVRATDLTGATTECELATNLYPGTTAPTGYRYLQSFDSLPAPTWTFKTEQGVIIEKRIWAPYGKNAIHISYRLLHSPDGVRVDLRLTPLVAWKDYHSEMHRQEIWPGTTWDGRLALTLPAIPGIASEGVKLTIKLTDDLGAEAVGCMFAQRGDWYMRFQHPREAERGQDSEEDLYTPGDFTVPLTCDEVLVVTASTDDDLPTPRDSWEARTTRQAELMGRLNSADPLIQRLAFAADQFVAAPPNGRTTIMAGYPWFADWGRDAMISLPGLTISTGRPEIGRDILLSFARYVDQGMLPNRFPDQGTVAEYNTVDAALWFFVAVYRYYEATGDEQTTFTDLWPALEEIVQYHLQGTRYGIGVDRNDWLLAAGRPGVQLTWMDAKVGDWVVTPRTGKPVEINALWINALRTMAHFAQRRTEPTSATSYNELAERAHESFLARFPRPDGHGLFDVLDPNDATVRPNQIFALTLPFPSIEPTNDLAREIVKTVGDYLVTPVGLRTLTPNNFSYRPRYEGDQTSRDGAYHQGTVWPWLLGSYAEALSLVSGDGEGAKAIMLRLALETETLCAGSLAEIYDGDAPRRPRGCIAQAWSVAETLRVLRWMEER